MRPPPLPSGDRRIEPRPALKADRPECRSTDWRRFVRRPRPSACPDRRQTRQHEQVEGERQQRRARRLNPGQERQQQGRTPAWKCGRSCGWRLSARRPTPGKIDASPKPDLQCPAKSFFEGNHVVAQFPLSFAAGIHPVMLEDLNHAGCQLRRMAEEPRAGYFQAPTAFPTAKGSGGPYA